MASGFIILKDGRCFAPRWTGYDEIMRIAIKELKELEAGVSLAEWLSTRIPADDLPDDHEMGWGFVDNRINDTVSRELDLRSLTSDNQTLFWRAIQIGKAKLSKLGEAYSYLSPDFFDGFYQMYELAEKGAPPLEFSDWRVLADPCEEKNGPGWEE